MCELLKTVWLLKSDLTKDKIKPKKLIITKKNCKNTKDINLLSNIFLFLKFLIENRTIKNEKQIPKIRE